MNISLRKAIQLGVNKLKNADILTSEMDSRILMCKVLKLNLEEIYSINSINEKNFKIYLNYIEERLNGISVAKIIGKKEFYGNDFIVYGDILDPREDSEVLIDAVLSTIKNRKQKIRFIEFGTGSGCLSISLLLKYQNALAYGVDINQTAIHISSINAKKHGVANRFLLELKSWNSINHLNNFDILISNPPYIATSSIDKLEFKESRLALNGGSSGLEAYLQIFDIIKKSTIKVLYLEIDPSIRFYIIQKARKCGFLSNKQFKDLSGSTRCILFKRA
ncbi:MAG: HemK family protein methyltransferase [Gammaproteobacteria bacterium]|nr:HemK family protein methyltransferase [Gammaproteobacteria bacterium]